jgi:RNA polymerase sigma-70 factor (ECF subfamily)
MKGKRSEYESDRSLLSRAVDNPESDGGREAASELLGRYRDRVYIWCYRYVREHEHASDLAQDVLLNAYRNLSAFAGRSSFPSWLFAIARNRCISEMRRASILHDDSVEPEDLASDDHDPAVDLEEWQDEQTLLALIRERLTPVEQEAIWMRCVERMPLDAITRILRIDQRSGARGVLQQARRKLRVALDTKG